MDQALADSVWDTLHELAGRQLRIVTVFDGVENVSTMRDDIREHYSDDIANKLVDQNIVDLFSEERLRETVGYGSMDALVRYYPDVMVVSWSHSPKSRKGVMLSMDRSDEADSALRLQDVLNHLSSDDFRPFDDATTTG